MICAPIATGATGIQVRTTWYHAREMYEYIWYVEVPGSLVANV